MSEQYRRSPPQIQPASLEPPPVRFTIHLSAGRVTVLSNHSDADGFDGEIYDPATGKYRP